MRILVLPLLFPFLLTAQVNTAFLVRSNLPFTKIQSSGSGLFGFEKDGKIGYADKNGTIVVPAIYTYDSSFSTSLIPNFEKGYARVKNSGKFGVIDKTGKLVIPIEHEGITLYTYNGGNLLAVTKTINGKKMYGVLNTQNQVVLPIEYESLLVDSAVVTAKQNGKWGLFDKTGKQLLPHEYSFLNYSQTNDVLVTAKGTQCGVIDRSGKWLFEKSWNVYSVATCKYGMIPFKVSGKYGYLDLKGNEVIVSRYDGADDFNNLGLARVYNKKPGSTSSSIYGYIDKKGTEVIPIKYEEMGSFTNGLAYAKDPETNRYGFMDKTGKWILQPAYLTVNNFDEYGGAWVKMTDDKFHYINKTGKDLGTLDETGKSFVNFVNNGYNVYEMDASNYVLLDKTGAVIKRIEDCDGIYNFSQGIGGYKCKSVSKYGFIDVNGNKITACDFDGFDAFTEAGIAKVTKKIDGKNKSGYVDAKGNIILPIVYDNVYNFRDGWGLIYKDGNYFFVDKNGNLKESPAKYDELYEFRSGYALAKMKGTGDNPHTYYYINTQLKEEFSVTAKQGYSFWEDVAVISRDNVTYELVNKKGKIFKTLTNVETLGFCVDGMLAIRQKGKWGYINDKGDMLVTAKYDTCTAFKYGYGRIKLNNKWGIVDKSGTEIIAPKHANILPGENGYFIFYDNGWGMMDKTGKVIIPPGFGTITTFEKDRAMAKTGKTFMLVKSPLAK